MKRWIQLKKYFRGGSFTNYMHIEDSEMQIDEQQRNIFIK
jgi:hypothetical protein